MNEIGYKEFQDDVNQIFANHIKNYSLSINRDLISEEDRSYICFLENAHIRIELSLVTHFPHIGVSWIFYYRTNNDFIKLNEYYLDRFIGIDYKLVEKYHLDLNELKNIENTSKRHSIQVELKYASKIFELYSEFINGSYTYAMYKRWLDFIKINYNLKDTKIKLPSYNEIFNK